ncbi:hypothetical protein SPSYN_02667 [Sporotomaculum syntrophicum]|uniref:Stage II sporulation protein M n=1 Tax=Sporotomaculum syntrophicum TaxID=182264 RepID=A0A9D2WN55_9FIRM|nr:stage II sporulation protein M [Sporotomaculum syntrophicum]KAF1084263.1 hypothetical protein SPSYN_02667 [Sporotomaculum syntrophicum]
MLTWFAKGWQEIRNYRQEGLLCLAIFALAAFTGHLMALLVSENIEEYYDMLREMILANPFGGGLPDNLFLYILTRNSAVSLTVLVLGIITYNVWPVFILLLNGAIGGFVVQMQAALLNHPSWQIWLIGLLPHGVPELGALFLAAGASFYYRRLRSQGERVSGRVLTTYLVVVLPLLVLAAAIETYITPLLLHRFLF